jgi:hypothetical protein
VAVDTADNVIVLGHVIPAVPDVVNDWDLTLDAYDRHGTRLWDTVRITSPGAIEANHVIADDRGNVYVVGGSTGELSGATDYSESRGRSLCAFTERRAVSLPSGCRTGARDQGSLASDVPLSVSFARKSISNAFSAF